MSRRNSREEIRPCSASPLFTYWIPFIPVQPCFQKSRIHSRSDYSVTAFRSVVVRRRPLLLKLKSSLDDEKDKNNTDHSSNDVNATSSASFTYTRKPLSLKSSDLKKDEDAAEADQDDSQFKKLLRSLSDSDINIFRNSELLKSKRTSEKPVLGSDQGLQALYDYQPFPEPQRYDSSYWVEHLFSLSKSEVFFRIRDHLFWNVLVAAIICLMHEFVFSIPELSKDPHELVGTALGLLLVFRTDAAYGRYWEGRQLWERIIANSRSLTIWLESFLVVNSVDDGAEKTPQQLEREELVDHIERYITCFPYAVKDHLRRVSVREPFQELLTQDDLEYYFKSRRNRPLKLLKRMDRALRKAIKIVEKEGGDVTPALEIPREMVMILSSCERISSTPVPLAYARHSSRFLTIWSFTLPFVFVGDIGFYTIPVVAAMCWALFSIEELGMMIEQPFELQKRTYPTPTYRSQLPLDEYCAQIRLDIEAYRSAY